MMPITMPSEISAGGAQTSRKCQKLKLPVWPIRMFCGLPITVTAEPALDGAGQRDQEWSRIEIARQQPAAQQRRHGEDHDVVGQHRRQTAAHQHRDGQQHGRAALGGGDAGGAPVVEAGGAELRRDDHQREQQQQGRRIDGAADILDLDRARGQQHHQPQQARCRCGRASAPARGRSPCRYRSG